MKESLIKASFNLKAASIALDLPAELHVYNRYSGDRISDCNTFLIFGVTSSLLDFLVQKGVWWHLEQSVQSAVLTAVPFHTNHRYAIMLLLVFASNLTYQSHY